MINRGLEGWKEKEEMAKSGFDIMGYLKPKSDYRSLVPEHPLTQKLEGGEIPNPQDVASLLSSKDENVLKLSYLAMALLANVERREGKKPYVIHPLNAAAKADYRYDDPEIPSGYKLTDFQKALALIHDFEMFPNRLEGFYVLLDSLRPLLGDSLAEGLDNLTNKNEWVMKPVETSLEKLPIETYKRLGARDISDRLKRRLRGLEGESERLVKHYEKFIERSYKETIAELKQFVSDMWEYHQELSTNDKNSIGGLLTDSFIEPIRRKFSNKDTIEPLELIRRERSDLEHVISMVDGRDYFEADKNLIHPRESPYLVTLDKTLYRDFTENSIMRKAEEAYDRGKMSDDTLLSVPIVKGSDTMATVATLEYDVLHAISQFRKSRQVRASGNSLIQRLSEKGANPQLYQRFVSVLDYVRRNLVLRLKEHYEFSKQKVPTEDNYKKAMELFGYMLTKEGVDLTRLGENRGWLRSIGQSLHLI